MNYGLKRNLDMEIYFPLKISFQRQNKRLCDCHERYLLTQACYIPNCYDQALYCLVAATAVLVLQKLLSTDHFILACILCKKHETEGRLQLLQYLVNSTCYKTGLSDMSQDGPDVFSLPCAYKMVETSVYDMCPYKKHQVNGLNSHLLKWN